MRIATLLLMAAAAGLLIRCGKTDPGVIPHSRSVDLDDTYTIIWHGVSKAYRFEDGAWHRFESYDYTFDVVQKRYPNHWKSVKTLHRIHPEYDGNAGNRHQTMFFDVVYKSMTSNQVQAVITSTLGNGTGITDTEFRKSELTMYVPDASPFMPYNKFRIVQHYHYEQGLLTETVELLKEKDGKEIPFMKNEETAFIFLRGKLDGAPTRYIP